MLIVISAYGNRPTALSTPRLINVEMYQDPVDAAYGTNFKMQVVYFSAMMAVAYSKSGKEAGLDGQIIRAEIWKNRLEVILARGRSL